MRFIFQFAHILFTFLLQPIASICCYLLLFGQGGGGGGGVRAMSRVTDCCEKSVAVNGTLGNNKESTVLSCNLDGD